MKKIEAVMIATEALVLGGVLCASFSYESKQRIIERLGERCVKCGKSREEAEGGITFHHFVPAFFLKFKGLDADDPKYGVPLCRHPCHDEEDKRVVPEYERVMQAEKHTKRG